MLCLFAGKSQVNPYVYIIQSDLEIMTGVLDNLYEQGNIATLSQEDSIVSETGGIRVSKDTIYKAGKKWYQSAKEVGNRFFGLYSTRDLLPLANKTRMPIYAHESHEEEIPLMELLAKTKGHVYLVGEGGIGKTTALYNILKETYDYAGPSISQIPLYVELSMARSPEDFDLTEGAELSFYIRNSIQRQLQAYLHNTKNMINPIEELLSQQNNNKEYLLLLDGLNEVSHDELGKGKKPIIRMIIGEIKYILKNYKNTRVILTSRSEELFGDNISTVYLSGIKPQIIEKYLTGKGVSEHRIRRAMGNTRLMPILRIPLFLTLYSDLGGEDEYLSRGEILHAFFTKRVNGQYSVPNRLHDINTGVTENTGIDISDGITPEIICFMIVFILSEIAWNMLQNSRFQIDQYEIEDISMKVLGDRNKTSVCGKYGKKCFSEFDNTLSIANSIIEIFGKTSDVDAKWDNISWSLCNCFKNRLGILQMNDDHEYVFIHHHIRDYFAALHHINRLRLACYIFKNGDTDTARQCLNEWIESPLLLNQLSLIGEALGEPHNAPFYNEEDGKWIYCVPEVTNECDRNLIKRTFDIYRHRFDGEDGYTVWNLFQILKLTREDLSGEDFSCLDLSFCRANGFRLGNGSFACRLEGAKLNDLFFLPMGHTKEVISAEYSPDGRCILTSSRDGTTRVWDAKTFQEIPERMIRCSSVNAHYRYPDGKYIITTSDGSVKVWDTENNCNEIPESPIKSTSPIDAAVYSPDGKYILTSSYDGTIELRDGDSFAIKTTEHLLEGCAMAKYTPNGNFIMTADRYGTIRLLDASTLRVIPDATLSVEKEEEPRVCTVYVACSQDEKYIAVANSCTVKIWDIESLQEGPCGSLFEDVSNGNVCSLQFCSNDIYRLLICDKEKGVSAWDVITFREIRDENLKNLGHAREIHYSPKGKYIVSILGDSAKVWDAETFQEVPGGLLKGHKHTISDVEVSPDGRYLVSFLGTYSSYTGNPLGVAERIIGPSDIWDLNSSQTLPILTLEDVQSLRFSKNGNYFVTTSYKNYATVWDARTIRKIPGGTLVGHSNTVWYADFSRDEEGKYIITSSLDGTSKIWNTKDFSEVSGGTLKESKGDFPVFAQFSPDGKTVVTKTLKGIISVWSTDGFDRLSGFDEYLASLFSLQYTSKGILILHYYFFMTELRDAESFREIEVIKKIDSISFSDDEKYAIIIQPDSHFNRIIKIIDTETHQDISEKKPIKHNGVILARFCAHDKYIVTVAQDNSIKLWDAKTYEELHTFQKRYGLEIWGVDISHLHEQSDISEEVKGYLKEYGAIID